MDFKRFNTIYFWMGGRREGEWKQAMLPAGADFAMLIDDIRKGGRVAHYGHTNVGPPEGPPDAGQFEAIGV